MRNAVVLLLLVPVLFASATITFTVNDGKVYLTSAKAVNTISNEKIANNLLKADLTISTNVENTKNGVSEDMSLSSSALVKNSLIKRGWMDVTFNILSNKNSIDVNARMKGSALVALFFVRDMDVTAKTHIDKQKGTGEATVSGYVIFPAPQVTVKNLLKVMIPKLKKAVSEAGLKLVELKYEVSGKKVPPLSKVTFEIVVSGSKDKILKSLNVLGIPMTNITKILSLNDTVTRKVDGSAKVKVSLKRVGNVIASLFNVEARAHGTYLNTTVTNEIKKRLKVVLEYANAEEALKYLLPTDKASMKLEAKYQGSKYEVDATFNGVAFKNAKGFWEALKKIEEKGAKVMVVCNGKTLPLEEALSTCG